jgi:hypothetical protein
LVKKDKKDKDTTPPPPGGSEPSAFRWFFGHVFSIIRKQGGALILWITIAYCVRQVSLAAIAYAGRSSSASFGMSILANVSFVWTTSLTVSGISVTLYFRELTLHRKTRERLTKRITELELQKDPTRTSSKLTPKGLTRKEDE